MKLDTMRLGWVYKGHVYYILYPIEQGSVKNLKNLVSAVSVD